MARTVGFFLPLEAFIMTSGTRKEGIFMTVPDMGQMALFLKCMVCMFSNSVLTLGKFISRGKTREIVISYMFESLMDNFVQEVKRQHFCLFFGDFIMWFLTF